MANSVRWQSSRSFIFAAAAAAIGLGNVWRFPYLAGQNGGAAFVLVYLLCVAVLGLPLLYSEIVIGLVTRKTPVKAVADLAKQSLVSTRWRWLSVLMLLAAFLIMTYYVVIVGWVLDYTVKALLGQFANLNLDASKSSFQHLQGDWQVMLLNTTLVVVATMAVIYLGIKNGLERAVLFMFPAMLVLMACLLVRAMTTGHFYQGLHFLFALDFNKITIKVVLEALGQAFFSMNIAMGVTMMFSAYLPEGASLKRCTLWIAVADTGFALIAGTIIFPIVFAYHLQPSAGPSLIFQTLPLAFAHMPAASFIASLFFIMLFFAAFSSVIALLEPPVAVIMEHFSLSRIKAVFLVAGVCWLLSLLTIGSFSHPGLFSVFHKTFFAWIDFLTAAIMLPVGGILLAVFVGWKLRRSVVDSIISGGTDTVFCRCWFFILRYIAPCAIILILLMALKII